MGTVEQVMMATVAMDAVVDFATANAQTLIIMYCMVSMSILAWNEYSLRKTEESKANVQDKPLAAAEQPLTTCGSTTGTGAGHGAGDDEDEGEEEAFNGVGSFLTDIPTDVKEKMLQWHKLTFVRSRKQVCCEQALQVFNAAVKLFDLVRKVLLFVPPVGPMIKNVIDSIVNAPILADVLAFIQWLVLSAITMSPAVYQIIGTDKNGKLVSVLYIYEMSGCYVRMFNNPQKRAAKLIAKTEDGRVAFEFGVKQSCCGMCPPYGSIRTCGEKKEKVCHTAKPQKGGCFAVCAPREIGRVKITKKLKDGEGNEPKPLRVIQSRFCPMSCGSSSHSTKTSSWPRMASAMRFSSCYPTVSSSSRKVYAARCPSQVACLHCLPLLRRLWLQSSPSISSRWIPKRPMVRQPKRKKKTKLWGKRSWSISVIVMYLLVTKTSPRLFSSATDCKF